MIIDDNNVFLDGPITASGISDPVPLNSLTLPGRMGPLPLTIKATEDFDNLTSLELTLQTAHSDTCPYTDLPGGTITIPLAELKVGTILGWTFLPRNVRQSWLRLKYTVNGTAPTKGKLFAAVTREQDQPYEDALYIDKGRVVAP